MPDSNTVSFPSISSISGWARNRIQYLDSSELLPYVLKENLYHYFSFRDGVYTLFCTSERDIQTFESNLFWHTPKGETG